VVARELGGQGLPPLPCQTVVVLDNGSGLIQGAGARVRPERCSHWLCVPAALAPPPTTSPQALAAASVARCRSGRDLGLTSAPKLAGRASPGATSNSQAGAVAVAPGVAQAHRYGAGNDLEPRPAQPCSPPGGPRRDAGDVGRGTAVDWLKRAGLSAVGCSRGRLLRFWGIGRSAWRSRVDDLLAWRKPPVAPYCRCVEVSCDSTWARVTRPRQGRGLAACGGGGVAQRTGLFCFGRRYDSWPPVVAGVTRQRGGDGSLWP